MLTISGTFVCTRRDWFGRSFRFLFLVIQKEEEQIEKKKKRKKQLLWKSTLAFYGSRQTRSCLQPCRSFYSLYPPTCLASSNFLKKKFCCFLEFLQCDENCCQQKEKAKAKADAHVAHQPYLAWHLIFASSIQCFSQRCAKKSKL